MSELHVLDELGRRLDAATAAHRRPPRRRWVLAVVVAAALAFVAAGGAVGSALLRDGTPPERTTVGALNATNTPGIAARYSGRLVRLGYARGTVANYPSILRRSHVSYEPGHRGAAQRIAGSLGIAAIRPMTPVERAVTAPGGPVDVLVVIGRDRL